MLLALAGCGGAGSSQVADSAVASSPEAAVSSGAAASSAAEPPQADTAAQQAVRVAGLKGPTSMGMAKLMDAGGSADGQFVYETGVYGTADEIVPKLVSGELDAAAIPANLASVLYNKTGGEVVAAAVNTLGVLYVVETGDTVQSVEDLRGKTVYSVGKGTTPEYVLNYILTQNGMDPAADLTVEYKSESTEVAAMLGEGADVIAVLPQPYVAAVQAKNPDVRIALDLTAEWGKIPDSGQQVTGVLAVRKAFVDENPAAWAQFLADYKDSIDFTQTDPTAAAELIAQEGIVDNAAVAQQALPYCHIIYADGADMKDMLGEYLGVLYGQNPEAVGGALPGDDFYLGAAA